MSKSHGYGTSAQHGAGFFTPPPMQRASAPPDRVVKSYRFQQRLLAALRRGEDFEEKHYQTLAREPVAGSSAIDSAVRRYVNQAGATRGMRKQTMAISTLPKMTSQSGGFVIKHRECLGLLTTANATTYAGVLLGGAITTNFNTIGMRLHPSNAEAFPWLSEIASRFEQYRWRKVNVQFITASGDGTTAALGQGNVMAYIEYNPTTVICPGTARDFLNNYGACAVKPSQSFQMGVQARGNPFELKWTQTTTVANAGLSGYQDPRFSTDGSLYVCAEGVPVNSPVGYLYIDYEIELHKPQVRLGG